MNKEFDLKNTIRVVDAYYDKLFFETSDINYDRKIFYSVKEWSGWRFYLKAIRYRDWRSLWTHIKNIKNPAGTYKNVDYKN